jgi:hypothetical protein
MDENYHHGPVKEQQNLASDRHGLRKPRRLQALRQIAFKCCFVLSGHPPRRVSGQVRELDGKPRETGSFPMLGC